MMRLSSVLDRTCSGTSILSRIVLSTILLAVFTTGNANGRQSEPEISYVVEFPNIEHHEARITATFSGIDEDRSLELTMSRTSPGRYALHEFAKNVYDVGAVDGDGTMLHVARPDPFTWVVDRHNGTVTVTYTLFGDRADGTYTGLDRTHAHMNMPATFMWARGFEHAPVSVTFRPPVPDWKVATQLFPTDDPAVFTAPDLYYFLDSPTEISDFTWYTWSYPEGDDAVEVRIALHHAGTDEEGAAFMNSVRRIVETQYTVFDGPPEYETGTYTFIVDYLPHVNGDGMEHRNSTIVTSTNPLTPDGLSNLGTMSHEFFHQWNVERIRPRALEPFDFSNPNPSGELWFAEGFTSYYTGLSIHRADLTSVEEYAHSLSGTINYVVNAPGRTHRSPVEMSTLATFTDAGVWNDPLNFSNTFISYYTWGSAIGLALDLTLRQRFDTDLDAFMRAMWQKFGMSETPYTVSGIQATLAEFTGSEDFAARFFDRYVLGREVADYEGLLANAGFLLRHAQLHRLVTGGFLTEGEGGILVRGAPLEGSPLYEAGVENGDLIVRIDGRTVEHPSYLDATLHGMEQGDSFEIDFISRGVEMTATVTPRSDARLEVVLFEEADMDVSAEMQKFRDEWLWN